MKKKIKKPYGYNSTIEYSEKWHGFIIKSDKK